MSTPAQTEQSPLAKGAPSLGHAVLPASYRTRSPFLIDQNTYVVAVVGGDANTSDPRRDGWFCSDFYAFNYLFKGLGRKQAWIAGANPRTLVERYGNYLHGNPRGGRKVVLSSELLDSGELSEVEAVEKRSVGEHFVEKVGEFGDLAYKEDGKLLLLIFCHGHDSGTFDLGPGCGQLSHTRLTGCIDRRTRTAIVTPACYSGSWIVEPGFNYTAMAAAGVQSEAMSWEITRSMSRACGSVFASALIRSLSVFSDKKPPAEGSAAEEQTWGQPHDPRPPSATEAQTAAFNEFFHTINSACGFVEDKHEFSFAPQNNEWDTAWTDGTGIPLRYFEERWNSLETHVPVQETHDSSLPDAGLGYHVGTSSSSSAPSAPHAAGDSETSASDLEKARLRSCITYFLTTTPGSWRASGQHATRWFLMDCHERGRPEEIFEEEGVYPVEEQLNAFAIMQYRMQFAKAVDFIVALMGLPLPSEETALFHDHPKWLEKNLSRVADNGVHHLANRDWYAIDAKSQLMSPRFLGRHTRRQGPAYMAMADYVDASLYEYFRSTGSSEKTKQKIDEFLKHFDDMEYCMLEDVKSNNTVKQSRKRWLESIGKA